jgi:hypothetical protein
MRRIEEEGDGTGRRWLLGQIGRGNDEDNIKATTACWSLGAAASSDVFRGDLKCWGREGAWEKKMLRVTDCFESASGVESLLLRTRWKRSTTSINPHERLPKSENCEMYTDGSKEMKADMTVAKRTSMLERLGLFATKGWNLELAYIEAVIVGMCIIRHKKLKTVKADICPTQDHVLFAPIHDQAVKLLQQIQTLQMTPEKCCRLLTPIKRSGKEGYQGGDSRCGRAEQHKGESLKHNSKVIMGHTPSLQALKVTWAASYVDFFHAVVGRSLWRYPSWISSSTAVQNADAQHWVTVQLKVLEIGVSGYSFWKQ